LLYLKGGAAVTTSTSFINSTLGGVGVASVISTRWDGTVGVGVEYGFSPNCTAGIEYDHLFMGASNNSFSVANPLLAGAVANPLLPGALNRINQDVDMVALRFNYKLGGPVVARY
jgi:outer membrane immunogenic protein